MRACFSKAFRASFPWLCQGLWPNFPCVVDKTSTLRSVFTTDLDVHKGLQEGSRTRESWYAIPVRFL